MSERERAVADALHRAAMENLSPSPSMLVDLDEYVVLFTDDETKSDEYDDPQPG